MHNVSLFGRDLQRQIWGKNPAIRQKDRPVSLLTIREMAPHSYEPILGRRLRCIAKAVLCFTDVFIYLFLFSALLGKLFSQTLNLLFLKDGTCRDLDWYPRWTRWANPFPQNFPSIAEIYWKMRRDQCKLTARNETSSQLRRTSKSEYNVVYQRWLRDIAGKRDRNRLHRFWVNLG
jgi:hypothetical protein